MKQNRFSSIFFIKLITLFHFSLAAKKASISSFVCLLRKQGYHVTNFARKTNVSMQVTNVGDEEAKLSRLLVQRINVFNVNEIQRKTPQ